MTLHTDGESRKTVKYILRIPRAFCARVNDDAAILILLRRYAGILCPRVVVTFEVSNENELGLPYAPHGRVEGVSLYHDFRQLSHADRCWVAAELGTIVR